MQKKDEIFLAIAVLATLLMGLVHFLLETRFRRVKLATSL